MHPLKLTGTVLYASLLGRTSAADWNRNEPQAQVPLDISQGQHVLPIGHFTRTEQNATLCPSYGEAQWTGSVTVSKGHDIFYWYFDSRNNPTKDPIIVWLNGGPGASSMIGLFTEMGPCWLDVDANHASPNPWSWNNNASVLFIDQPAGSGLSRLMDGLSLPVSEYETAPDFEKFLNVFFTDIFPEKQHLPIHMAAESYGGHYGPVYIQHILQSRRDHPDAAFWGKIKSLILINAGVDFTGLYVGVWDTVCKHREQVGWFNASACDAVIHHLPEQERLGRICHSSYDNEACRAAYDFGQKHIFAAMWDLVAAGKIYMGNLKKSCRSIPTYPFCVDPDIGNVTRYLNQDWAKLALNKEPSFLFRDVNMNMHLAFRENGSWSLPTTRQLSSILDARDDDMVDFRVLVLNGNLDFYSNTAGNIWVYERLEWGGQDEYREMEWRPLKEGLAATGSWKGAEDGRLVFIAVDEAGHTLPSDVREGSYRIVQEWLTGGWRV